MDATSFYRPPDSQLCQGDIFECVPHLFLKDRPRGPQPVSLAGTKAGVYIDELSQETLPKPGTEVVLPVSCSLAAAMLLTYDCEIDKDKKHRTVALIRPLPANMPAQDRATIQDNRRFPFFYLPSGGDRLPESYVDFRRICTISPQWVDTAARLASLTALARQAMLLQLFRFLSRVELNPTVFGKAE